MIEITIHFANGDRQECKFPSSEFGRGYVRALWDQQLITEEQRVLIIRELCHDLADH